MIVTDFGHLDQALQMPKLQVGAARPQARKVDHPKRDRRFGAPQGEGDGSGPASLAGAQQGENPAPHTAMDRSRPEASREGNPTGEETSTLKNNAGGQGLQAEDARGIPWEGEAKSQGRTQSAGTEAVAPSPSHPSATPAGVSGATGTAVQAGTGLAPVAKVAAATAAGRPGTGAESPMGRTEAKGHQARPLRPRRVAGYRSAVQETPEIPRPTGEAIIKRIALFLGDGEGEAVLDLNPPHLGRLGVRMSIEGDRVALHMHAQTDAVSTFLERNLEALRQAFLEQDLTVSSFTVSDATTGESPAEFARQAADRARDLRGGNHNTVIDSTEDAPAVPVATLMNYGEGGALNILA